MSTSDQQQQSEILCILSLVLDRSWIKAQNANQIPKFELPAKDNTLSTTTTSRANGTSIDWTLRKHKFPRPATHFTGHFIKLAYYYKQLKQRDQTCINNPTNSIQTHSNHVEYALNDYSTSSVKVDQVPLEQLAKQWSEICVKHANLEIQQMKLDKYEIKITSNHNDNSKHATKTKEQTADLRPPGFIDFTVISKIALISSSDSDHKMTFIDKIRNQQSHNRPAADAATSVTQKFKLTNQNSQKPRSKPNDKLTVAPRRPIYQPLLNCNNFQLMEIGVMKSCFKHKYGAPRQGFCSSKSRAIVQLSGHIPMSSCDDLIEGFSHIWLFFIFHLNTNNRQDYFARISAPRLNGDKVGVFASRSPHRPNPIGITLAKLDFIDRVNKQIHVSGIDLVDQTPIIDIKPYHPCDVPINPTCPKWMQSRDQEAPLQVEFTQQSIANLHSFVSKLEFYQTFEEVRDAIIQVVRADPRETYLKKKNHSLTESNGQDIHGLRLDRLNVSFVVLPNDLSDTIATITTDESDTHITRVPIKIESTEIAKVIAIHFVPIEANQTEQEATDKFVEQWRTKHQHTKIEDFL